MIEMMDSAISSVVATTTNAVVHVFTTNMPSLWVFLIGVGALLSIVGAIVGIFYRRKRRGRRR